MNVAKTAPNDILILLALLEKPLTPLDNTVLGVLNHHGPSTTSNENRITFTLFLSLIDSA